MRCSVGGPSGDMAGVEKDPRWGAPWAQRLGHGLSRAITQAVNIAAGVDPTRTRPVSQAEQARCWFIDSYPLLGALASSFTLIESTDVCRREAISVAAVSEVTQEIYLNPAAGLSEQELRFVIAHELLHVGLRYLHRARGRDPFLWNAACDFVINGWLVEMAVGQLPPRGALYDPALKGASAEAIYDDLVKNLRRARKLATLRGIALGDMLTPLYKTPPPEAESLDAFFRRCLAQGLDFHRASGRGLLPAGLVEEIRALVHPPIPWDVQLAAWFDNYFPPLERRRSFARPSRRQSGTPNIPRPRWAVEEGREDGRTFGVVLDTSGSMARAILGRALGAIASYSVSRDVPFVRVIFCDAAAYDAGYLAPEALASRLSIKGRGGTVLQPGIELLDRAKDFPTHGPVLLITDGQCDVLTIRREHAFLMPEGARLPFKPRGPVFRMAP
ncbi:MAG: VWA-like domain-containing protein [Gammaproteobacteria bacterium]